MKSFIAAASLLALALANPVIIENEPVNVTRYSYAADLTIAATVSQFSCLKSAGYSTVFINTFNQIGSGYFNGNAPTNYFNAIRVGLGTEFYMNPIPSSGKDGFAQFNEVYTGLVNKGIYINSIWIQVTSPTKWSPFFLSNINFINSIRSAAKAERLFVGIYTNFYDWKQITGGNYDIPATSGELLWYWNVYGEGPNSETTPDFNDFRSFGGWSSPTVKQYGQAESVCGLHVNRDVYLTSSPNLLMAHRKSEGPVVENFIH